MGRKTLVAAVAAAVLGLVLVVLVARRSPGPAGSPAAPGSAAPAPAPPQDVGESRAAERAQALDPHSRPQPPDENTLLVRSYPITMKRLEDYVAAVKEIRAAGERDASVMARLRQPRQATETPADVGARLDAIAPVKAILGRHGLSGIDLVIMPQVVLESRNARALEQEGRPLPPGEVNAAGVALYRADLQRMDALSKAFLADLRAIGGR